MKRSLLFILLMIVFGLTTTAGATLIGNSDGTITQVLGDTTLIWSQLDDGAFRGIWDQANEAVGRLEGDYELPGFEQYSAFRNELLGYSGGANGGDPLPFFIGLGRYWTDFDPQDSYFAWYFDFLTGNQYSVGPSPYNALAVRVDSSAAPVPEPGTILLLGSGLAGLAIYRRKTLRGGK